MDDVTTYELTDLTIDWSEVDTRLVREREMSLEFLKDALG